MGFPKDFAWGVATASYQIEGSPVRAGGGKSVWDVFCEREKTIANKESGYIACDHCEKYRDDVRLMKELGIKNYRLSISWPRVLPDGVGRINEQGLDFYDKLIDELVGAGITPWVTLFHWDFPYELYIRGGWLSPDSSRWFADYTKVIVDRLSDRVANWITFNEPQCFIGLGHMEGGNHAPGEKYQFAQGLEAVHNVLLAHGRAVQVIRANAKHPKTQIGFAPACGPVIPASNDPADIEAARTEMFKVKDMNHIWRNSWWSDPVYKGGYPEYALAELGDKAPKIAAEDMEVIGQPLDLFCVNIYQGSLCKAGPDGKAESVPYPIGIGKTRFDWPLIPAALYWGPRFFWERYGKPIVITENGMSNCDWVHLDGKVHDPQRIDFLARYLHEFRRAHDENAVDIRGYFQWSFMDNFEWAEGFKQRFGLVYVDYQTQQRIPKDSALWYKHVIETNGAEL